MQPKWGVPQVRLDFNFSSELMFESVLDELVFEEDLHANDELGLLLSRQVHFAKLSTAQ